MSIPNRPGIIIREPERERKRDQKPSKMDSSIGSKIDPSIVENMKPKPQNIFTIFTNFSKCKYSQEILDFATERHLPFQHRDVDSETAPNWLPGTPSVVYGDSVYCGDSAFKFVQSFENIPSEPEKPSTKGKIKDNTLGCDFASAFSAPKEISDNDKKYELSTDEMMQRLLQGRK